MADTPSIPPTLQEQHDRIMEIAKSDPITGPVLDFLRETRRTEVRERRVYRYGTQLQRASG
ncbi:MAG: hypothetical protein F4X74_10515 [Acidimicrobiia bacterium]|nr:hypothetical protein [Acidimicrobiia bacterium]